MGKPIKQNQNTSQNQKLQQITAVKQTMWNAPIPPPDILAEFEKVVPGSAATIIEMAHSQSKHRMGLEDHAVKQGFLKAKRGQIFGLTLGLAGLVSAVIVGLQGHDVLGSTLGTVSMGTLAIVLVIGRDRQKKSLDEKNPK